MRDNIKQNAKKSETKRGNLISRKPKKRFPQTKNKNSPMEQILHLQRTIGNRAVMRLIKSGAIQAKLTIGKPNDIYEKEADNVADRVMSMPEESLVSSHLSLGRKENGYAQTKPLADKITPLIQRQAEEEEEVQTKIQRQANEEEEESVQTKLIQRQASPEEEEEVQTNLQRQAEEEEEEPVQAKLLQRQEAEEEEEPVQTKLLQRQGTEEEEESVQAKSVQRQENEEEEAAQTKLQRQAEEEEETAQAKAVPNNTPEVTSNIESNINSMKGGGQPLSESTRSFFEPRFGADFSQVRLHTDSKAAETAKSINAKAFTKGKDVVFGSGQYSTGTSSGKRLLAHELTHVVQQGGGLTAGMRMSRTKNQDGIPGNVLFRTGAGSRRTRRGGTVRIRRYSRRGRLIFRLYDFGISKCSLRPEHIALLRRISAYINRRQILVRILGHASRSGPARMNMVLSWNRVFRAVGHLLNYGVGMHQLRMEGKGESDAAKRGIPNGRESKYDRAVEVVLFPNVRVRKPRSKQPTTRPTPSAVPRLYLARKLWNRLFRLGLDYCFMQFGLKRVGIAYLCALVDTRVCIFLIANRHLPRTLQTLKKACCTISGAPKKSVTSKRMNKCVIWYVSSKLKTNPKNRGINPKQIEREVKRQYKLYKRRLLRRRYGIP